MNETKDSVKFDRNLAFLKEMFPGRIYVNAREVARIYSVSLKTIYNWLYLGKCPVQPKNFGKKPLWSLTDIAERMGDED